MILRARRIVIALGLAAMLEAALAAEPAAAQAPRRLDLRAPDIRKLYTAEQLNRMLGSTLKDDVEEVEVKGQRERTPPRSPTVWPAIAAPFWAVLHPTQAWRILAPLPPDQTQGMSDLPPIATRGYLEPAATIPR